MNQKARALVSELLWHIWEQCHPLMPNFQAFTSSEHPHFYSSEKSQNSSNWWLFWSKLYLDCLFLFSALDSWGFWFNWFGHLPQSELFKYNQHNTSCSGCNSESRYLRKRYTCVQKWEAIHECWGQGRGEQVKGMWKPLPFLIWVETPAEVIEPFIYMIIHLSLFIHSSCRRSPSRVFLPLFWPLSKLSSAALTVTFQ